MQRADSSLPIEPPWPRDARPGTLISADSRLLFSLLGGSGTPRHTGAQKGDARFSTMGTFFCGNREVLQSQWAMDEGFLRGPLELVRCQDGEAPMSATWRPLCPLLSPAAR